MVKKALPFAVAGQHDDTALDEMGKGRLPRIRPAPAGHRDSGKHARRLPDLLERALHRQRIHHRRQHADRVRPGAFDAFVGAEAAEEVAAADNNRDLDAEVGRGFQVSGDARYSLGVETEWVRPHQRLSRKLHDDAAEQGLFGRHGRSAN